SASDQLWVYPDPGIQFSQEPLQLCAGEVLSLDFANPIGGDFVSPFVNNGVLTAPDSAFNGAGGIYAFGNVCGFDQDTFYLSVTPNPEVDLGNDTLICEGNALLLDAGSQSEYAWSDFSSASTYLVNGSELVSIGSQTVSVIVFDALGCSSSDEITIQVAEQPAFYLGDNIYACLDSVIELSVENVYDSFVWSTGDTGLTTLAHDGSIIMPGVYNFWAKGVNATGCSFTDSIALRLADCNDEFVGIEESSALLNELVVYPNPTRANLFVRWNHGQTEPLTEMLMYDMFGSVVKTVSLENDNAELIEISTNGLADGMYLLSVNTASANRTIRVLIQK
ncbi:MAG: T9SS type A sorting domain-containing protein, partial [Salibacteraceae bacterium]|nr:T9SS type A sorting domain-containing protein [Salibacteraceae bacterium]